MDEDRTLEETKDIMKSKYGFDARSIHPTTDALSAEDSNTAKRAMLQNGQFKEWKWQKKLPTAVSIFMEGTATKRKRETGKDTVFTYYGRSYTPQQAINSLARAKRPRTDGDAAGESIGICSFGENAAYPEHNRSRNPRGIELSYSDCNGCVASPGASRCFGLATRPLR